MKKQNGNKKWIPLFIILLVVQLVVVAFLLLLFFGGDAADDAAASAAPGGTLSQNQSTADGTDWVFYVYLCGSDIESGSGCATAELQEMLGATLSDRVKLVIQTGGAREWNNDFIKPGRLGRYLCDNEGLQELAMLPDASMGSPDTLADFLKFAYNNYPAAHRGVIFWDHGGGSAVGVCMDEVFDRDILTLNEIRQAFTEVAPLSTENPPFEMVGFDACLMATVDTAHVLRDVSHYLIGSEESEPGLGWHYKDWLTAVSQDSSMGGAELGKVICDTFAEDCNAHNLGDEITLSVTDLSKAGPLFTAYEDLGREALAAACADPSFLAEFGRSAARAENYGGNTPDTGYTNMVDLYDLVNESRTILPQHAEAVMQAVEDCVVYHVSGPYRSKAAGLSAYYSYNKDEDDYVSYCAVSATDVFPYLYGYAITGTLGEDAMLYIQSNGYEAPEEITTPPAFGNTLFPVTVNEGGNAVMQLDQATVDSLTGIYFRLMYMDKEEDGLLLLGRDNNIDIDWESGTVKDNFEGEWGTIDGNICYMEIIYEGEDYDLYSVPILLNGEQCNLRVAYNYSTAEYSILGTRKAIEETVGVADRNLRRLEPGDEITTIHYLSSLSGDEGFTAVDVDTFTVDENTSFCPADMGNGTFLMVFELEDIQGNTAYSQNIVFTVENGTISTKVEQ